MMIKFEEINNIIKFKQMKKIELILGGVFVLARVFAVCEVPVHGFLTLLSAILLYFMYFLLSF